MPQCRFRKTSLLSGRLPSLECEHDEIEFQYHDKSCEVQRQKEIYYCLVRGANVNDFRISSSRRNLQVVANFSIVRSGITKGGGAPHQYNSQYENIALFVDKITSRCNMWTQTSPSNIDIFNALKQNNSLDGLPGNCSSQSVWLMQSCYFHFPAIPKNWKYIPARKNGMITIIKE